MTRTTPSPAKTEGQPASRLDSAFWRRVPVPGSDAAWVGVEVKTETADASAVQIKQSGAIYAPPAQETLDCDADGNLIADGRWDYAWDAENRLIGMTTRTAAMAAGVPNWKLEFGYDHRSRRVMKRFSVGADDGPGGITWTLYSDVRFIYHGWNMIAEIEMQPPGQSVADTPSGSGQAGEPFLRRSYVWGEDVAGAVGGVSDPAGVGAGGVGGFLAMTRHACGTQPAHTYWATADLNGNVIGLISTTSTKTAVYDYDAFGNAIRVNEPEAGLNLVRFSSKYTDAETGLVYYGYRYYSPEVGRWPSKDPIGERGGLNLYGFVGNDGVNQVDLLGFWKIRRDPRKRVAEAIAEDGDTIRTLAKTVHLDADEAKRWAGPFDGHIDDELGRNCPVTVPNVMVVALGDVSNSNWLQELIGAAQRSAGAAKMTFSTRLSGKGFKIEDIGSAGRSEFLAALAREDIAGFWIGAHGGAGGIQMADGAGVFPSDVAGAQQHKFSLIYLNVCDSGTDPGWNGLLAPTGTLYAPTGSCGNVTGDGELYVKDPAPGSDPFLPFAPRIPPF